MSAIMDIVVRAQDLASSVLDRVGDKGTETGRTLTASFETAALALSGAGLAIEGLARSQQDATLSIRILSQRTGESEDAIRSWAAETHDATNTLADQIALMDLASRRGLEGKAALQDYARFWDMVGDATGSSSVALAEAGVALRSIGIDAGNEGQALAAFGYITDNTTSSVDDFLAFIARTGPDLRAMGVDVNDTAAILGFMENELGLTGRTARQQFNEAVRASDGDLSVLFETLGLTGAKLDEYRGKVAASSSVIERNADAFKSTRTPMQEWSAQIENLTLGFGPLIEQAAQIAPVLIAAGPAAKGVSVALGLVGTAGAFLSGTVLPALGSALAFIAANPIVLIVAAIVGLVAALIWLWENSEEFRAIVTAAFEVVAAVIGRVIEFIVGRFRAWLSAATTVFGAVRTVVETAIRAVVAVIETLVRIGGGLLEAYLGIVRTVVGAIVGVFEGMGRAIRGVWDGVTSTIKSGINFVIGMVNRVIGFLNGIRITVPSVDLPIIGRVGGFTIGLPRIPTIPQLATGAWDILDDMLAVIHRGEMVVPAGPASVIRAAASGFGGPAFAAAPAAGPLVYIGHYSGGEAEDERLARMIERRLGRR